MSTQTEIRTQDNPQNNSPGNANNIYAVVKEKTKQYFDTIEKTVPKYHQSVTQFQQECCKASENAIESIISTCNEFAKQAGWNVDVPEAVIKATKQVNESAIKAFSMQNQIVLATIDAAKHNIETFNENTRSFTDLNRNLVESCIAMCRPQQN